MGFPSGLVVKKKKKVSSCNAGDAQKTRVWPLGREDPLEKEMTIHFSILAKENPMDSFVITTLQLNNFAYTTLQLNNNNNFIIFI